MKHLFVVLALALLYSGPAHAGLLYTWIGAEVGAQLSYVQGSINSSDTPIISVMGTAKLWF